MATYSTEFDPAIDAIRAAANAGTHGPSYDSGNFKNANRAKEVQVELIFRELCAAMVDNSSLDVDNIQAGLLLLGNRLSAGGMAAVGFAPRGGTALGTSTNGTGGITVAAGTEAVAIEIDLIGPFAEGTVMSVNITSDEPSDDTPVYTVAGGSETATEAAAGWTLVIDALTDLTATSSAGTISVVKTTAGVTAASALSIQP